MNSFRIAVRSMAVVVAAAFLVAFGAAANDSTASLDTGGIRLLYNGNIEMKEEDLYLSSKQVRVRYVFENKSRQDIKTLVAFPLPDIATGENGNYAIMAPDPVNFIRFEVSIDGQAIAPSVETRATSNGLDVTALLAKHGLPLTTITASLEANDRLYEHLRNLPEATLQELERYGAVDRLSSSGQGLPDVTPRWTAHITFYWEQTFPAGRKIEVTHKYRPVPREFFTTMEEIRSAEMKRNYCTENDFLNAAASLAKKGTLAGTELRYIVTTAGNWSGPIGRFTLTIDKEDPKFLVSTCFDGLKRTGPTTFSATRENYRPNRDLGMLVLKSVGGP
jgi:hypothetical protein